MKVLLLTIIFIISYVNVFAQIGIGTTNPHSSAVLEIKSSTKGFLPPRVTNLQLKAIENPTPGLMVYCYDCCYDNKTIMFKAPSKWDGLTNCTPCDETIDLFTLANLNSASNIIGQPNETTSAISISASSTPYAYYMSLDNVSGKVFVSQNSPVNRITRYSSLESFLFNEDAEAVIGQLDLSTGGDPGNPSANNLHSPKGMALDKYGHLWVVDAGHNRVLKYENASTLSNQPNATLVLGQPDFTTATAVDNSANGLNDAYQIAIDEVNGTLWVDVRNKVYGYKNYNSITNNGHPADIVLGANAFSDLGGGSPSQSNFDNVRGLTIVDGDLYVSDAANHRIMRFNSVDTKSNGALADDVYFQPNFTTNVSGSDSTQIKGPFLLSSDYNGNLYITAGGNDRIAVIENIKTKSYDAKTTHYFGTGIEGTSADQLKNPRGVSLFEYNGQKVIAIADKSNHRIVVYGPDKLEITEGQNSNNIGILSGVSLVSDNISYSIESQPSIGVVSLNTSTGVIGFNATAVNITQDTPVTFKYKITNEGGCNRIVEQSVLIKNVI